MPNVFRAGARNPVKMTEFCKCRTFLVWYLGTRSRIRQTSGVWEIKRRSNQLIPNIVGFVLTSSLLMSSLLNVRPGMIPRFFSQKIAAKDPEKKMPSTAAKAMILSPKVAFSSPIHLRAQSAFFFTHGRVSTALNR